MLVALLCLAAPAAAAAFPPYDGGQMFPAIHGPEDPEDYTWEVQLGEEQTLEAVDDQHAVVRYENGSVAFTINAEPAHDATGATVPTTIAVTEPNLFTLTVHHLAGSPAAGGAPFTYPISAGAGWEGGVATVTVTMPPATETSAPPPSAPACLVPDLAGRSLKAARRQLRRADCRLGKVRGERKKGAKVVRQYRKPGKSLPARTEVGVKLAA